MRTGLHSRIFGPHPLPCLPSSPLPHHWSTSLFITDFSHRLLWLHHRLLSLTSLTSLLTYLCSLRSPVTSFLLSWAEPSRYLRRFRKNRIKDHLKYPWRKWTTAEHKGHKGVSISVHIWYARKEITTKPQYIISAPHTADQRSTEKARAHPATICPPQAMSRDGAKHQHWV